MITRGWGALYGTDIIGTISAFNAAMQTAGFTVTDTRDEYGIGDVKYYFTTDEYILLSISSSRYLSMRIQGTNNSGFDAINGVNTNYLRYTIVKTGNSVAIAFNGTYSTDEGAHATNKIEIAITQVGNKKVSLNSNYLMIDSIVYSQTYNDVEIESTYNWVQLVPFASPVVGSASAEVFLIRFSPLSMIEATINNQKYIIGEYFAIKG